MDEFMAIFEKATGEVRTKFQEMTDGGSIKESILGFLHAVDWTVRILTTLECWKYVMLLW
jgi:hypothetical protein